MDPRTLKSDFVMYRGMLTRMFTTPYTLRESWAMNVTKLGSTLYIEEDLSPEDIKRRSGSSDQHRELMYSGYRFESLCVLNEPPSSLSHEKLGAELEKRRDSIVNTNTEYCTVFRTRLGVHSIISGAEIDCIDGEKPAEFPNRHYRELKTANVLDTQHKIDNFERYKLLRFWAQSFISGTPTITVGYRDSDCILRAIEDIRTQDIPHRVKGKPRMWSANVCINFADMLLGFIKNSVTEEGPEFQYRISFDAGSDVIQLTALGPRKPFLTQEYISMVTGK
ncbi:decapping endonuclease targeting mRNA [Coemansia sp. RSA 1285]|nr:decapping endonuclease targeting mRNA [Coemansia sp. RSA 1285]